ncbi:DUF2065 family protein [Escherichia sp. TW09308]|nr:DUF2065 family protein [Escherichia sp. TW09308]
MNEFDNLAGACSGFGAGRFRADALPTGVEEMISAMTNLPDNILRRFGGGLVVAGVVVYYMLRKTIG